MIFKLFRLLVDILGWAILLGFLFFVLGGCSEQPVTIETAEIGQCIECHTYGDLPTIEADKPWWNLF